MSKYEIVQITDTHLTPSGEEAANNQQIDPLIKLNNIFKDISLLKHRPDMIVITGDLIHQGTEKDYQNFSELISSKIDCLNIPINVILGNHDRTANFFKGYLKEVPRDKYYYLVNTPGLDIYFLDSKSTDHEEGCLGVEQLIWLKDNLADAPEKPAVVFLHHPLDGPGLKHMRYGILQDGADFFNTIKGTEVKGVFSGHIHFETAFQNEGVLFSTADSAAYHINCDDESQHFISDATSYDIITFDQGEVGVEKKTLLSGQAVVAKINIPSTSFIDQNR
ncbi:metallophosphoesterase [Companilactobacillus versmoldensis]|uniref:Metallophosphoesterase n=1 Tax=Companilactobacillus versmoldensis DSM 14857 = KCTC 3814 TaxID=1423815 RepID=A0A0R1SNF0_9LACO|nr:metallophosphoesterase [Companilactobacillus versmoldensis]KRL67608.1 metallophosphoesterase [Companilactobacillus versmoldensis DSM 14857 = KCTC 3814]